VSGCPAVAPGGRGSTSPGVLLPGRSGCSGWSAGREGLQAGGRDGDLRGPGPAFGEAEPQAPAAPYEAAGDGEHAQAQAFGLPAAGGAGEGEQLRPGQQLAGQRDDLAPELVLSEPLQWQVPQPGVLGAADPVLAACPPAVAQLQVSELPFLGVGGESGEPVAVDIGERS
jgi:hypothetical protein